MSDLRWFAARSGLKPVLQNDGPSDWEMMSRQPKIARERWQAVSRASLGAVCLAQFLCACTSVEPVSLTTRDAAAEFRSRRLDDPKLEQFAAKATATSWPPARWDTRTLDIAALYFNPALATAHAKWQAAEAAIVTAGEIPNPTLNVAPQFVANVAAGVPAWVVASSLVQIIETAGKRGFRVARARYRSEAARLDALNAAWETIGAVNGALVDFAVAGNRAAAIDRQVAAQSALVEIADKRLVGGLGSSLEVATARAALNNAVLEREAARAASTDALHQVAEAVGVPVGALQPERIAASASNVAPPEAFRKEVRQDAVLNRADLLARLADYAANDAALQLEAARQYPDIELGPGYEYDQGEDKWGVSLALPIPLFNQNQGAIGEALAARRQAADEFSAVQARVIGEVDRALDTYDAAARSLAIANDLVRRQNAQLRAKEALFAHGEVDRVELLSGRAELATAEVAQVDAEGALAKARLGIEQASQHSLSGFDPASLLRASWSSP